MKEKVFLILIFILGFSLRFWHLGLNPPSLDWDEASLSYNAYSLLKTGRDEYGTFLPLSIRSFGDYKPPLYSYLAIIPIYLFGLNEYSSRFISAFLGSLTVLAAYYLAKEIFSEKSGKIPIISTFFFALSPWHIQFSRIAFEANTGLFFFVLGILLFTKGLKRGHFFLLSFISLALSMYAYHSPRLIVPLLLIGLTLIFRKEIMSKFRWFLVACAVLGIVVFPIIQQIRTQTAARLASVTVINPDQTLGPSIKDIQLDQSRGDKLGSITHNRRIIYFQNIIAGYLDHFNFDFLFLTGDPPGRHHASEMGMLYLWDLPFILIGLFFLIKNYNRKILILLIWFLLAPVAAALTTGTPHAVRALYYLPLYQIFTATGLIFFLTYLNTIPKNLNNPIKYFVLFLFLLNFFYYLDAYWVQTPVEYSQWWQYGYKQAVTEVSKIENNYTKVIVTYKYDQPYIYFLFYEKIDPSWYQKAWGGAEIMRFNRSFGKYEFRNIDWPKDRNLKNTLIVGTPDEIPQEAGKLLKEIHFLDGSVAFRIVAM